MPRNNLAASRVYRVAVNGLPHFCRKLSLLLSGDPKWEVPYRSYSPVGLAERFRDVARCDLAYSWGARISMGKFLWAARSLGKNKVVLLWSGSDVLFAKDELAKGKMDPWVRERVHWAVSPWLAKEVRELGIDCEHVQVSFVDPVKPLPLPEKFSVLVYIPSLKKADLYGLDLILRVARKLSSIEFTLIGFEEGHVADPPTNLKVFGKVDLAPFYKQSTVLWRPVRHDGLSFMVLEALARGRHVLYSQPLPGCVVVNGENDACEQLENLHELHASGRLASNGTGRQYIERNYNSEKVRNQLLQRWEKIIEGPEEEYRKSPRSGRSMRRGLSVAALLAIVGCCAIWCTSIYSEERRAISGDKAGELITVRKQSTERQGSNSNTLGDHYLMLVNTAIARLLKPADIAEFDKSSYDGLAIGFHYNYDTAPVFSTEMMDAQLLEWKKITKKDLWPWVYFNRMIGAGEAATNERVNVPYFKKIQGIDLDDKAGAKSDFLQIWKSSLRTAKDTKAPGVFLELEYYNYHKEYDAAEMAGQTGKSVPAVVVQLQELGATIADIAAEQYPGAVIWMPFTGFTHKDFKIVDGKSYYPTPVYIVIGMLERIQNRKYNLRIISGGEGSLGYCHDDVAEFRDAINKRAAHFASVLKQYSGILELAGTMTVWSDRAGKSGFVAEDGCAKSSAANIEELQASMELLLKTYRYNWIYGSSNGSYFAFDSRSAPRFNAVISKARSNAYGWKPR